MHPDELVQLKAVKLVPDEVLALSQDLPPFVVKMMPRPMETQSESERQAMASAENESGSV
jgi:hypothetical protein